MNLKCIKSKAKCLHKALIIGTVSVSLLGILSGCHTKVTNPGSSSVNLTKTLVNHQIHSKSLYKLCTRQYKWPVSDPESDGLFSDAILHKGYLEASDGNISGGRYFSHYGKNYDQTQPSDDKSKAATQTVHYYINNKKDTITFSSIHANNTLHTITYKLIDMPKSSLSPNKTIYKFKPIRLNRFGHKYNAKIPGSIARHNILKLHIGSRVHYKHSHSLNDVQK